MKKLFCLFFSVLLFSFGLFAQRDFGRVNCKNNKIRDEKANIVDSYRIKITLDDTVKIPDNSKLYLYAFQMGDRVLVDSALIKNRKVIFRKKNNTDIHSHYESNLQAGFYSIDGLNIPPILLSHTNDFSISCKSGGYEIDKSDDNKVLWTLFNFPQQEMLYEVSGNFLLRFFNFYNELSAFNPSAENSVAEFEKILNNFDFSDSRFCNSMYFNDMKSVLEWYLSSENFTSEEVADIVDEIISCASSCGQVQSKNYCRLLFDMFQSAGEPFYEKAMLNIYDKFDRGWIPEGRQRSVKRQIEKARRLAQGAIVPELMAYDIDGKVHSTKNTSAKYTILWFWDPDCDHCQEETPKLHNLFTDRSEELDFDVFAVEVNDDFERWKSFSEQHHLDDWINLSTSMGEPNVDFIEYFDIVTTPVVVLVDNTKGGAIMARQISLSDIIEIIEKQK